MLKGINKNIIEINPNGCEYFEKVIIILKNSSEIPDEDEIEKYAALMLAQKPPVFVNSNKSIKMITCGIIGAVFALLCCAIGLLFV